MMKNKISSPYRKLRLLLILPVAAIVLYAFAEPQYRVTADAAGASSASIAQADMTKSVKGVVLKEAGTPLEGAVILIKGTTLGTTSDAEGRFALKDVSDDAVLVISYVGFTTKVVSVKLAGSDISVTMQRGTVVIDTVNVGSIPPPPPPPPPSSAPEETAQKSLGRAIAAPKSLDPESKDEKFVVIEEMPHFPDGDEAMIQWLVSNIKYPAEAKKDKIQGMVMVGFVVSSTGKIVNVKVKSSVNPILDAEALRVIENMPDWTPGTQSGKPVDVEMSMPVQFRLQ